MACTSYDKGRRDIRDVANGRKTAVDRVRSGMGQGRCVGAAQAKASGMVDGVMPFPTLVSQMFKGSSPKRSALNHWRAAKALRDIQIIELS